MDFGYNTILDKWKHLYSKLDWKLGLAQFYAGEDVVLRYPDGQESINAEYYFDDEDTNKFIDFCRAAQVSKVVLRGAFYDIPGTIRTYELFLSKGIDVIYIEASNEPWNGANMKPLDRSEQTLLIKEGLFRFFIGPVYHKHKANQYADNTLAMLQAFEDAGHQVHEKFAFACDPPIGWKRKAFWDVLSERLSSLDICAAHIYAAPQYNWDFLRQRMQIMSDKFRMICTEANGIHFGKHGWSKYAYQAFTIDHERPSKIIYDACINQGYELLLWHVDYGFDERRKFHRIQMHPDGTLEDRMAHWNFLRH